MKFYLLAPLVLLAFSGCAFFRQPALAPIPKTQPVAAPKPVKTAIKGYIKELTYVNEKYCYVIIASDTSHAKLKNANFCANRHYYDKGDLVYATFIGERLDSMILIREASAARSGGVKKPSTSVIRARKSIKTNIALPKEEKISF